ncbi:MAG: hypothetical protein QI223_00855 [Candidatus Korarchaeota archaeon]|nr:hypothetical protein [Candidatus Korarchaeota archaeon]
MGGLSEEAADAIGDLLWLALVIAALVAAALAAVQPPSPLPLEVIP